MTIIFFLFQVLSILYLFDQEMEPEQAEPPPHSHGQQPLSAVSNRTRSRVAQRSSCVALVIIGASSGVLAELEEDDLTFFGESLVYESSNSSDEESEDDAPAAKRPYAEESWIEEESEDGDEEVPVSAVPEGEDDGAGPLQNLEAVAELVRDGCGCNNANQFTTFEGVSIVDFQQQLTVMSSREVDLYLMGLLAARCTKCEPVRHHQSAAAAAQDRQRINNFWLRAWAMLCAAPCS